MAVSLQLAYISAVTYLPVGSHTPRAKINPPNQIYASIRNIPPKEITAALWLRNLRQANCPGLCVVGAVVPPSRVRGSDNVVLVIVGSPLFKCSLFLLIRSECVGRGKNTQCR